MSTMQSEVFEALRAIEIPEDRALRAASALGRRDGDVAGIKAELLVIRWMIGALFALLAATTVPIGWLVIRTAIKVGALS